MNISKFTLTSMSALALCGLAYSYISNSKTPPPIQIVDYASIECPDSEEFYLENGELLRELYNDGKISYIFKPVDLPDFDYDKYIYEHMTNKHLEFNNLISIFQNQSTWSEFWTLKDIQDYLMLNPTPIKENVDFLKAVKDDVKTLNISSYPAIYVNGTLIDYNISKEELRDLINKKLPQK